MTDCFDPVAIRITQEGAVIRNMILGAQSRRSIIQAPGRESCPPKGIDILSLLRFEAPVATIGIFRPATEADQQIRALRIVCVAPLTVADPRAAAPHFCNTERSHDCIVELLGNGYVGYSD